MTADKHRAPDLTRHLHHGNNTLAEALPGVIVMGSDRRFHGATCQACAHFTGCPKTPTPTQTYCAMVTPQFQPKGST